MSTPQSARERFEAWCKENGYSRCDWDKLWEACQFAERSATKDQKRCSICGFIVDTRFAAEKPSMDFTMAGRHIKGRKDAT